MWSPRGVGGVDGVGVSRARGHRAPAARAGRRREKQKRNRDGHVRGGWRGLRRGCADVHEHQGLWGCKSGAELWIFGSRRRFRYPGMTCDTALEIRPDRGLSTLGTKTSAAR